MNPKIGEFLVLRRIGNAWVSNGSSKPPEQAVEEARRFFGSGSSTENDTLVVQVTDIRIREFDPR